MYPKVVNDFGYILNKHTMFDLDGYIGVMLFHGSGRT